jgi:nucleoside-diphosphate-sugar epimerase
MNCGITGHTGVLGKYFVNSSKKLKFKKYFGDINNKKKITEWILNNNFDYLFHFAAVVPIKKVEANYKLAKKTNYIAVKYIVDALKKKNKPIWFFFSSTSHVYGFSAKKFNELSKTKPINEYGKLKFLAEKYIEAKLKNTKIYYCVGRIFSYTHFTQSEDFFIPSIFQQQKINFPFDKINTLRDFIDIRDICRSIKFLMKRKLNGFFNIASGKSVNLLKIYLLINKNIKYNLNIKKPQNNILANINKIKNFGWYPKYNIIDTLENFKKKI